MQGGANAWHVSGFFGVTMDTLEKYYAHHHPDYVKTAVNVANNMGKSCVSYGQVNAARHASLPPIEKRQTPP
ncbi:hypothetical protein [Roseovarius confluentis]|jgi:broad specificity polyphosphatase/5'/3'-nucleotidase SurE